MAGYQIFRNGTIVNTAPGTTFTDTGLAGGTSYTYTVRARDAAGNTSAAGAAVTATTQPGGGGGSGCTATYRTTNSWDSGFQAEVTVTNTGTTASRGWSVVLTLASGRTITNLWNGTLTANTVTNAPHNGALPPTAATTFGFVANGPAANAVTITSCATS